MISLHSHSSRPGRLHVSPLIGKNITLILLLRILNYRPSIILDIIVLKLSLPEQPVTQSHNRTSQPPVSSALESLCHCLHLKLYYRVQGAVDYVTDTGEKYREFAREITRLR